LGGAEAAKAIARLGDLSPAAIHERLQQMRQPANLPSPALVKKIIESQRLPIASGKAVEQLRAALQPVLDYHGRGQTPIYVLQSEQPKAHLVECAVIIITTRMMASASEEEMRGIVAHELAHECVWDERIRAREAKSETLMRELELFCDAVATFTLKEIGDDPASYGRILGRLTQISIVAGIAAGNTTRREAFTHPSLDTRKKLNKFLCQRLDPKKPEELLPSPEASRAIARLGDLSPAAVRERLQQMRRPAYLAGPALVNKIIEAQSLPIAESKRVDQLKAALQPALDYHKRGKIPIYVLWSKQPKAYFVQRAVIIITTGLLYGASDQDICGIVAHELAHEYVWDEGVKARNEKDGERLREIELFCDAVAVFTLKEIGGDPASYARALDLMTLIRVNAGFTRAAEYDSHPSLDARRKLNKLLCQRLD
jgi:predicted SprT family Zn-dependent metalloprotease